MSLPIGPRRTPLPSKRRLTGLELAEWTGDHPAQTRRLIRALRTVILKSAPHAAEAIRFRALCYFDPTVAWGAIGGNICMIVIRRGRVCLDFIQGASLPDPRRLLSGSGKFKRYLPIDTIGDARGPVVRAFIAASAANTASRREG